MDSGMNFRGIQKWRNGKRMVKADPAPRELPLRMQMDKTRDIPSAGGFGSADSTAKNTAMEKRYSESDEVRAEMERKANQMAPTHKGAYEYVGDNANMAEYGRKNAVL